MREWRRFFGKMFCHAFSLESQNISPIVGTLSTMPVKKSVLGLLNLVTSTNEKYISLKNVGTELILSVTREDTFSNTNKLLALREENCDG